MKKNLLFLSAATIILCFEPGCKKSDSTPQTDCSKAPVVSAGDDIVATGETTVALHGTSSEKTGTWAIVEGDGGKIESSPSFSFTGEAKRTYKLMWSSQNDCGKSSDEITVTLNPDCGAAQTVSEMADNMHWIEQSCFRINAGPFKIYTDPLSIKTKDTADIIVITHAHGDHFSPDDLDKVVGQTHFAYARPGIQRV